MQLKKQLNWTWIWNFFHPISLNCRSTSRHWIAGFSHNEDSTLETSFDSKLTKQAQIRQRLIADSNIRVKSWNPIWPKRLLADSSANFLQLPERFQASKRIYVSFCATKFEFQVIELSNQEFSKFWQGVTIILIGKPGDRKSVVVLLPAKPSISIFRNFLAN